LTSLHLLGPIASLPAPCLAYSTRAAWRTAMSVVWNPALERATGSMTLVRLALHPSDAEDAHVRRSWQRCLGRLLADRTAVTKAQFARAWADSLKRASAPSLRAPTVLNTP
jgi:hypothetical protein